MMTDREAYDWCDQFRDNIIRLGPTDHRQSMALQAMRNCMNALSKRIPKGADSGACPGCGRIFLFMYHKKSRPAFCDVCGQALDWGDIDG